MESRSLLTHTPLLLLSALLIGAAFPAVSAAAAPAAYAVPLAAKRLPLSAVRLTGGPLKEAQDADARYLLELEPDRMLAGYRLRAGLEPKAEAYGGWDSVNGKQLTGHIAGHYLSAVSLMSAANGDAQCKERADYLVRELKEVQDKRGTGYLGALTDNKGRDAATIFEEEVSHGTIRSGSFDLNGMWSPWYTLHKTFAGLRDAYRYTGNETALQVEIRFAEWAEGILAPMTEAQIQRMLNTEFGGMNEVFVDLYADTGNPRWLDLSYKFEHRSFTGPLKRHVDNLAGKHGNTQVPKLIGSAERYAYAGNASDLIAASFFWDRVAQHHTFATGGHGKDEYFGEPDELSERVDGRTAETCNVYNMLKLTRRLFEFYPDAHYADFQERALFNHILASLDPETRAMCYMVPVGRGVQHEYQDMFRSFTCCVGTGMESHALHGDGIYFVSANKLWVNLYAPSVAEWKSKGATVALETGFPLGDQATLKFALPSPKTFTLELRRPYWAGEGFAIRVNGKALSADDLRNPVPNDHGGGRQPRRRDGQPPVPEPGYFVDINRTWQSGDTVEVILPKTLRLEPLADNTNRVAILWGPLVLAGDLGPEERRRRGARAREDLQAVPVLVAAGRPVEEWVKPLADKPATFRTDGVGRERDVELVPFYRLHHRTYAIYWDLYTPEGWKAKAARERKGDGAF